MKSILKILFILTANFICGQNLVPNPSFEDTTTCPNGLDQVNRALGWSSFGLSPEYYNSCAQDPCISVPFNCAGYQSPATGQAYCCFNFYADPVNSASACVNSCREFIGRQLSSPLIIGTKYFVSFKACLAKKASLYANLACDKVGAKFSKTSFTTLNGPPLNNIAHLYSQSIITDTVNWTKIKGSFIADSAYNYIMLGNFFDDANTNALAIGPPPLYWSYYYIDDICVSTDSLTEVIGIEEKNNSFLINIFPVPATRFVNIDLPNSYDQNFLLTLHNQLGQVVKFVKDKVTNGLTLERQDLPAGIYFLNIEVNGKHYRPVKVVFVD